MLSHFDETIKERMAMWTHGLLLQDIVRPQLNKPQSLSNNWDLMSYTTNRRARSWPPTDYVLFSPMANDEWEKQDGNIQQLSAYLASRHGGSVVLEGQKAIVRSLDGVEFNETA